LEVIECGVRISNFDFFRISEVGLRISTDFPPPMLSVCFRHVRPLQRTRMWQVFKEFMLFLKQEKKWWLAPLVLLLLILGAIIIFSSGSALAPLMYPFM
jgi:hypothetical protein